MYQQTRKQTTMKQTNKQFCIQKRNKKKQTTARENSELTSEL